MSVALGTAGVKEIVNRWALVKCLIKLVRDLRISWLVVVAILTSVVWHFMIYRIADVF